MIRGVLYRGTDIRRELESILTAYRPTIIALPHREDRHPDHCSTSIFVREALEAVEHSAHLSPRVLQYLIHYDDWPNLDEGPGVPLDAPSRMPAFAGEWQMLPLSPHEIVTKEHALQAYASQWLVIERLMHAFERPNELFVDGWPVSAPDCWCDASHVATEPPPRRSARRPPAPHP
jgi:LmbE family N-acetylglucosaminyl deacetylase